MYVCVRIWHQSSTQETAITCGPSEGYMTLTAHRRRCSHLLYIYKRVKEHESAKIKGELCIDSLKVERSNSVASGWFTWAHHHYILLRWKRMRTQEHSHTYSIFPSKRRQQPGLCSSFPLLVPAALSYFANSAVYCVWSGTSHCERFVCAYSSCCCCFIKGSNALTFIWPGASWRPTPSASTSAFRFTRWSTGTCLHPTLL